jgi:hypothetical protein
MSETFSIAQRLLASQQELYFAELLMRKEIAIAISRIANYYAKPPQVHICYFKIVNVTQNMGPNFKVRNVQFRRISEHVNIYYIYTQYIYNRKIHHHEFQNLH